MSRIGIVTGLRLEARIVNRWRGALAAQAPLLACDGPGPEGAYAAARRLADKGAEGLVSFGIAGALDPALGTGTAVVPETVADEDGRAFACSADWRRGLAEMLPGLVTVSWDAALVTTAGAATSAEAKAALRARSGAGAVDMESAGIARAAAEAGLPLLVVRVIADEADQAIPQAALQGLHADGSTATLPVLAHLARHPGETRDLLRLARRTARARRALGRLAYAALPRFGLV